MDERNRGTISYLQIMRDTAHALSASLQDQDVLEILLHHVVDALAARAALVRILSPDGEELVPAAATGVSDAYLQKGAVRLSASAIDRRVIQGETVVVPNVTKAAGFQYPEAAAEEGLTGMVAVPMKVRARVMGVLRVYMDDTSRLTSPDILLMEALADLGALALEKVRLHQSLFHIARALNSSLELKSMLREVLEATVREMGLKAAAIRLLEPERGTLRLVAAYGLSETYIAKGAVHVTRSPVDQRALRGETVVLYDVAGEAGFEYPQEAREEGIRSVLVVPLRLQDRTLGVLRAYSARPRHFSPVGIHFLTSVAYLVALAIEKAQLYAALAEKYEDLKLDLTELYRFLALG